MISFLTRSYLLEDLKVRKGVFEIGSVKLCFGFMDKWEQRNRPLRLERRFEFEDYGKTRDFLDSLGEYSESVNRFPDISFGKTYVNITLRPQADDQSAQLTQDDFQFAAKIDELID